MIDLLFLIENNSIIDGSSPFFYFGLANNRPFRLNIDDNTRCHILLSPSKARHVLLMSFALRSAWTVTYLLTTTNINHRKNSFEHENFLEILWIIFYFYYYLDNLKVLILREKDF